MFLSWKKAVFGSVVYMKRRQREAKTSEPSLVELRLMMMICCSRQDSLVTCPNV